MAVRAKPAAKGKSAAKAKPAAAAEAKPAVKAVAKARSAAVPRQKVKRAIGRPSSDSKSRVGREKLLKTACDLLKVTPPNKLTRFLVAEHAGVDPSLIRYYFRDRISLLSAAADRLSDQYSERLEADAGEDGQNGIERLSARLDRTIGLDVAYAHFRRLMLDELVGSDVPQARSVAGKIIKRGAAGYREIVQDGVKDGTMRSEDPVMLFIATIGLASYFTSAKTVYELATGQRISQVAMAEKYRAFISGLLQRGMAEAQSMSGKAMKAPVKAAMGKAEAKTTTAGKTKAAGKTTAADKAGAGKTGSAKAR